MKRSWYRPQGTYRRFKAMRNSKNEQCGRVRRCSPFMRNATKWNMPTMGGVVPMPRKRKGCSTIPTRETTSIPCISVINDYRKKNGGGSGGSDIKNKNGHRLLNRHVAIYRHRNRQLQARTGYSFDKGRESVTRERYGVRRVLLQSIHKLEVYTYRDSGFIMI